MYAIAKISMHATACYSILLSYYQIYFMHTLIFSDFAYELTISPTTLSSPPSGWVLPGNRSVLETMKKIDGKLPVNIKWVLDGSEEFGS